MSAFKFNVGEPRAVKLAFDSPKTGTNHYGNWYLYGTKEAPNGDDGFFATPTLHAMIQTIGAGEGDEILIEKCQDGDKFFYKVNGLTMNDMNSGGSAEKIDKAKPHPLKSEAEGKMSYDELLDKYNHLKDAYEELSKNNEIPF
ncbi:MAG: hypothetical protein GOVbin212_28 [Prokaryotic dsDNA virus sp.]|nr:MAG: hypothetical protein GOVbin212_28 [Prokaryotic dsDNA virus sp.]|tara:strand:- start:14485 stop:14913 length:429 start_codon:yes stop_codon:yes gene_type:complete